MRALICLGPGHFHAALTLRERHPLVREEVVVYAPYPPDDPRGSEVVEFLALVEAFNKRAERPTAWRPDVRIGDDPLGRATRGPTAENGRSVNRAFIVPMLRDAEESRLEVGDDPYQGRTWPWPARRRAIVSDAKRCRLATSSR